MSSRGSFGGHRNENYSYTVESTTDMHIAKVMASTRLQITDAWIDTKSTADSKQALTIYNTIKLYGTSQVK